MASEFILIFHLNYFLNHKLNIFNIGRSIFEIRSHGYKKQTELNQLRAVQSEFNNNFNNDIRPCYYWNFNFVGQNNPQSR